MADATDSLLDREANNLPLPWASRPAFFSDDEHPADGRNPTFTAARFFEHRPEDYQIAARLRAEGVPIAAVARLLHVSRNTIAAVDRREASSRSVEQYKQEAAASCRHLATLARERLEELLLDPDSKIPPQALAIMMAVSEDKALLLSGQATSRLEVVERPDQDAYREMLEEARLMAQRMRLEGETRGTKGGPAALGAPAEPAGTGAAPAGAERIRTSMDLAAGGSGRGAGDAAGASMMREEVIEAEYELVQDGPAPDAGERQANDQDAGGVQTREDGDRGAQRGED